MYKHLQLRNILGLFIFAILLPSAHLHAQEYYYNLSVPATENKQISHRAGQTVFINAAYNATTKRLLWEMTFQPSPSTGWLPNGLYFIVNDGFFPKGRQGETAIFFFDATDITNPKITAYAYNGNDSSDSWKIGDYAGSGAPDPIISSLIDTSWINSLKVNDIGGMRIFSIDINVTKINSHIPKYPSPRWFGAGFADYIGIWAHPVANMITVYDGSGFLNSFKGNSGYVDIARDPTAGCDGIVGSNKQTDVCGVCGGNGTSCKNPTPPPGSTGGPGGGGISPECVGSEVKGSLLVLDSRAAALNGIVRRAADRFVRLAGKTTDAKRAGKNIKIKSQKIYLKAWQAVWSVPSKVVTCPVTLGCVSIDFTPLLKTYEDSVKQLSALVNTVNTKLKRLGKKTARDRKKIRALADAQLQSKDEIIKTVPLNTMTCP